MVSNRKYFSIVTMFVVLLFLFQFSQVMKEGGNDYDTNSNIKTADLKETDAWTPDKSRPGNDQVYFLGSVESEYANAVINWSKGTKRRINIENTLDGFAIPYDKAEGTVFIIDPDYMEQSGADSQKLYSYAENGAIIIFAALPKLDRMRIDNKLSELLDIKSVIADNVNLSGISLFEGFLIGGSAIYEAKTDREEKTLQDMDTTVPWYLTGNRSETFMVGLLGKDVEDENLPAIIWRAATGEGKVYAINGDYMKESMGMGILDAMLADAMPYYIYPVVNSQNVSVTDFSPASEENDGVIRQLYSRDMSSFFQDIIWPGLYSVSVRNNAAVTCYITPQMDYTDDIFPKKSVFQFYLKQFKERKFETGISEGYKYTNGFARKKEADKKYFEDEGISYKFNTAYVPDENVNSYVNEGYGKDINTILSEYRKDKPVISYIDNETTLQRATLTGNNHTYRDDFRMKCIQTALAYSNTIVSLKNITWPESEADRWESVSGKISGNIITYQKPFKVFDNTTASECDLRIRNYYNVNYSDTRTDDTITLDVDKRLYNSYFILRLHNEEIEEVENGSCKKIEEGAYIIKTSSEKTKIKVKKCDSLYYVD